MRIAFVAPLVTTIREPQAGGSQAFLADLAGGLTKRGHAVDVYAATGSQIPGVRIIDTGADPDRLTGSLYRANGGGPTDPRPVEAAFAVVYAAIRSLAYDVVHNHAFDAPAVRLATSLSSPVVHTLHLPPDLAVRAAVSEVQRAQPPPTIATVSAWQANAWGITTILPNGVPIARIPWSDNRGEGVVFAGRLSPEKGAAEAIEIARKAGIPIDLYGDAYDPEYAAAMVSSSRAVSGVSIHSGVAREVLWRVMGRAAAVLCPAKWDEPFGLVAAEAQATGTPVVAFRRGALEEVVVDGETGFLASPGDVDGAAQAVMRIESIGRPACRRHAETHLSLDRSLDAHERLYEQVHRKTPVPHG